MHRPSVPKWADADELHREHRRKMQELIQTSTRIKPKQARKRKEGGGRDKRFDPKQQAALQREYRRYKKNNPGPFKYTARDHLQRWAKSKFGIEASPGTIRTHIMKPVKPRPIDFIPHRPLSIMLAASPVKSKLTRRTPHTRAGM